MSHIRPLPLFDNLLAKVPAGFVLTAEKKSQLIAALNSLDVKNNIEVSLLLVHYYFVCNPGSNPFTSINCNYKNSSKAGNLLPYGIRVSHHAGYSFDSEVPTQLQGILCAYCNI